MLLSFGPFRRRTVSDESSRERRSASSFPIIGLAALLCVEIALTGCGHKHRARVHVPPPPTISPPETNAGRTPPPRTPEGSEIQVSPNARVLWSETGLASWYGPPYHNRQAADGSIFNTNAMTAANNVLPFGSVVRVTNLKTGHFAVVRITDRGPFYGKRIIDLSEAAAKAADVYLPGTAMVRVDVLSAPAPITSGGRWCVQVGAFPHQSDAIYLKQDIQRHYQDAQVLQFPGPTGYWVRVKVPDGNKQRAQQIARSIHTDEGGVFMVRLD